MTGAWFGVISWLVIIAVVAYFYVRWRRSEALTAERIKTLEKNGVRGHGVIVNLKDTGTSLNDNPQIQVTYRVRPDQGEPFETSVTAFFSRVDLPRVGDEMEIWYDPNDVSNFGIGEKLAPAVSAATSRPDDVVGRIERAAQLRDRGELTSDEFEALKRKLLGS